MPSYCRVIAECFFGRNLKEARKSVYMGFLVAEIGFEPMTFGNSVSVHLQRVSNIRKKPILWASRLKNISKAAHSLTSKCHSKLNKYLTYTAELLPSASIAKSISKKQETKLQIYKFGNVLLPSLLPSEKSNKSFILNQRSVLCR